MKYLLMLLCVGGLFAQDSNSGTKVRPSQLKEPVVSVASVRIVMPSGTVIYAQLDMGAFTLDTTTTPPTLRVTGSTTPPTTIATPTYHQIYLSADGTYPVPDGKKGTVYRNGLLQMPGIDFVLQPNGVRFLGEACCEADEIVVIAIYQ